MALSSEVPQVAIATRKCILKRKWFTHKYSYVWKEQEGVDTLHITYKCKCNVFRLRRNIELKPSSWTGMQTSMSVIVYMSDRDMQANRSHANTQTAPSSLAVIKDEGRPPCLRRALCICQPLHLNVIFKWADMDVHVHRKRPWYEHRIIMDNTEQ